MGKIEDMQKRNLEKLQKLIYDKDIKLENKVIKKITKKKGKK